MYVSQRIIHHLSCVCIPALLLLPLSHPDDLVSVCSPPFFFSWEDEATSPKASDRHTASHTPTWGLCARDKASKVRREGRGHWKMCAHTRGCGFVCVWSPVIRRLWRRKASFSVLVSAASRHSHKHTSSPGAIPVISHQSSSPACPCSPSPRKRSLCVLVKLCFAPAPLHKLTLHHKPDKKLSLSDCLLGAPAESFTRCVFFHWENGHNWVCV